MPIHIKGSGGGKRKVAVLNPLFQDPVLGKYIFKYVDSDKGILYLHFNNDLPDPEDVLCLTLGTYENKPSLAFFGFAIENGEINPYKVSYMMNNATGQGVALGFGGELPVTYKPSTVPDNFDADKTIAVSLPENNYTAFGEYADYDFRLYYYTN